VFSAQWPVPPPTPVPAPPPAPPMPLPQYSFNSYMPLWRLKLVTWNVPANAVVLKSQLDITSREGVGATQVTITDASVAVGASIVINSLGAKIPQASVVRTAGLTLVRLPIMSMFVGGTMYRGVMLDSANTTMAFTRKCNFAPWLSRFSLARWIVPSILPAYQTLYSFWPYPPPTQLLVASQIPTPWGPANTNANYSPVMDEWSVNLSAVAPPLPLYKSAAALAAIPKSPTNHVAYMPIIGQ
jgi:hypothetical protein